MALKTNGAYALGRFSVFDSDSNYPHSDRLYYNYGRAEDAITLDRER